MDRTTRRINKNLSEIQALFVVGGVTRYRSIVDCRSLVVEKIPKLAERETKRISIQLYATIVLHAVISYSTIKHPTYSTSRTLNGISQAGQAAMVRPVRPWPYRFLRGEKWRRLDCNLRVRYRMASPSGSL